MAEAVTFTPSNPLEESLVKSAHDPAHRPQFYRDLLASDIFLIHQGPPPDRPGTHVAGEGERLIIRPLSLDGKEYLPIFSSLAALQAVLSEQVSYVALNAAAFFKMTTGADVVLNPGSDYGKELTKDEIARLLDGSIWKPTGGYEVQRDTQVQIGQPARYPKDLVEALSRLFTTVSEVRAAYLALFYNPGQDERPHTLIAIEVTGNWESVVAQAGIVAGAIAVPDPPVDFMRLTDRSGFGEYFRKDCRPFYERLLP